MPNTGPCLRAHNCTVKCAPRSPPVEVNAQQLIAPEAVKAIPELEFDLTANLTAEAGHDRLVADAEAHAHAHAEPIPELEFDQTLGW